LHERIVAIGSPARDGIQFRICQNAIVIRLSIAGHCILLIQASADHPLLMRLLWRNAPAATVTRITFFLPIPVRFTAPNAMSVSVSPARSLGHAGLNFAVQPSVCDVNHDVEPYQGINLHPSAIKRTMETANV
jgi:hypothetical protein